MVITVNDRVYRKVLLVLLKYVPITQMLAALFSNIFLWEEMYIEYNVVCYSFGNSIAVSLLLILSSYIFLYCTWQRVIIYTNFVLLFLGWIGVSFAADWDFYAYSIYLYSILSIGLISSLVFYIRTRKYERSNSSPKIMLKRAVSISVLVIPIMQLGSIMVNNLLCYNGIESGYWQTYLLGNSVIFTVLLYIFSLVLKLKLWHKIIILTNFLVLLIGGVITINEINISDTSLILLYSIVQIFGIVAALITYNICKLHTLKINMFID